MFRESSCSNHCFYRTTKPGQHPKCAISKPILHSDCEYPFLSEDECPINDYGKRSPDLCDVRGINDFPLSKPLSRDDEAVSGMD